jgi:hypothetical protein
MKINISPYRLRLTGGLLRLPKGIISKQANPTDLPPYIHRHIMSMMLLPDENDRPNVSLVSTDLIKIPYSSGTELTIAPYLSHARQFTIAEQVSRQLDNMKKPNIFTRIAATIRQQILVSTNKGCSRFFLMDDNHRSLDDTVYWISKNNLCPTQYRLFNVYNDRDIYAFALESSDLEILYKLAVG